MACALFRRIGLFRVGSTDKVVYTNVIQIGKLDQYINGIIQHSDLILGVRILADPKVFSDLLLCVTIVDSQAADILKFHNLVAHNITQINDTIS